MESTNFIVENKLRFAGNTGYFNEQPLFVLSNNESLTGNNFLALVRTRSTTTEAVSGQLSLFYGSTAGLVSATGSNPIYPLSVTADDNSSTATQNQYIISTAMTDGDRLDVIIKDSEVFFGDMTITALTKMSESLNFIGTGMRPGPEATPPNGVTGKSQVLLYTYNREELGSQLTGVEDRSNNSISADVKGTSSGDGTSATITGWTYGPVEGGFRLNGESWIESLSSHHFNANTADGLSVMMHVKLSNTGNTNIFTIGSSATEVMTLKENGGVLELTIGASSVTAANLEVGRWYHIASVCHNTTASNSGSWVYVNGNSASFSANMRALPVVNSDTRLVIGRELSLSTSSLTGVVGLTRVFNRPLSATEIMLNYLATIPSMAVHDSLKIG